MLVFVNTFKQLIQRLIACLACEYRIKALAIAKASWHASASLNAIKSPSTRAENGSAFTCYAHILAPNSSHFVIMIGLVCQPRTHQRGGRDLPP